MTQEPDISLSTERLLQCQEALGQLQQARAEVEQLQRENDALRKSIHEGGMNAAPLAEVERLNGIEATGRKMWHEALAEIERLRREIGILKSLVAQYEKP